MELSSLWYLSVWSIISQVSFLIALVASKGVSHQFPTSIWDLTVKLLYILPCFSSFYAFCVRPTMQPDLTNGNFSIKLSLYFVELFCGLGALLLVLGSYQQLTSFGVLVTVSLVPIFLFTFPLRYRKGKEMGNVLLGIGGPLLVFPSHSLCYTLFTASILSVAFLASCQGLIEAKEIALVACEFALSLAITTLLSVHCSDPFYLRIGSYILQDTNEKRKMAEISLGWLGYVLAQYCIQEKSISVLVMLSSFAIYWLSILSMIQATTDLGIFNFFVGAILDSAISLFGLSIFTWIILAGCVVLLILQRKLNSVTLRFPRARRNIISNWLSLEKQIHIERDRVRGFYRAKVMEVLGFYRAKGMEEDSIRKGKLRDDVLLLFFDLFLCAEKLLMGERAGKEEESKDELIDTLYIFTLQLLEQKEEGMEEESRDELIHTLGRLHFQLRNVEEKGVGEQIKNYRIALCLYLVWCLLKKEEKEGGQGKEGKDEDKKDGQEKDKGKEEETEDALEKGEEEEEDGRESEEGKEEEIEDGQEKVEEKEQEIEEKLKYKAKEATIVGLCHLILGQLLQEKGKGNEDEKEEGKEARIIVLCRLKLGQFFRRGEKEKMKNKKVKATEVGLYFLSAALFFKLVTSGKVK